ncbi:MAG: orotidine-5-phosphate decarboxylase [Patescibacteria group bacterium]|nr:orotidine-5-phosphate decarboxylase [Patescibacteria group bacterium]
MSKQRPFFEKLRSAQERKNSLLCVGLDPDHVSIAKARGNEYADPARHNVIHRFCSDTIAATAKYACAFKPNAAFFSCYEKEDELQSLIFHIQRSYSTPVILDAKRGDIGNTAERYAEEAFVRFGADAVTVNPYMGCDTIEPFLKHEGKGVIVLCRTSNPGGSDFQDLVTKGGLRLYERVAVKMAELDERYGGNRIALVVGATRPSELARVRELVGDMELLIPGIGAQGGDVEATVKAGKNRHGAGMMINSSRGIIYAQDPAKAARATRDEINSYR